MLDYIEDLINKITCCEKEKITKKKKFNSK